MFRRIRIAVLLLILLVVALNTWTDSMYTTRWESPIYVALYPINADGSAATQRYIDQLAQTDFGGLEDFFATEGKAYRLKVDQPFRFTLAPQIHSLPPQQPRERSGLQVMIWSLKLRWWAWREPPKPPGPTPRIRMFLMYFDPSHKQVLDDSTGLSKGLIGIAQLFADQRMDGSNQVVAAHELLHTLNATDKYDLSTGLPRYPDGYAEPDLEPRYPQRYAELMGGRIPQSPDKASIPESLRQVVIGPATAAEIRWLSKP